jgi:predicted HAD superfamily Cof-like phosphohydrolase
MNKMQQQVKAFHIAFGAPVADKPTLIPDERGDLRADLIYEEWEEYGVALDDGDLVEIADALGDLLYVVFGAAIEHGIDLEPVFNEIHASNMSKLGADGKPITSRGEELDGAPAGKFLKGPGFQPPENDIKEILIEAGAPL